MKNFKNKLNILLKLLIYMSFTSLQILSIVESKAETTTSDYDSNTLGIESVDSSSLRVLNLKRVVYVGECPGTVNKQAEGYFVDYETPVKEDHTVILQNFARGLSPNNPPSIKKDYDNGRASEKIKFKLSNKPNKVYLSMRPGLNPIKYAIIDETNRKEKKVVKSGVFMLKVRLLDEVIRRDKEWGSYSNSYYCPIW
tara:strand:+ start:310 stop:900 length:591 start_codon:yes stop_codon:yes gene_type:complete